MNIGAIPEKYQADGYFINTGDAMNNSGILDGDAVFVELGADFDDGDIVVVEIDGEPLLRHIWRHDDGSIVLAAANHRFPALAFQGQEKVKYIGRAVCLNRMLNKRAG